MPSFPLHSHSFSAPYAARLTPRVHCTRDELAWAATTVGKRSVQHVLRHGLSARYEIVARLAILHASLVEAPGGALRRSDTYRHALDPSEKGAYSYFLGLTTAKLLAERFLETPWLIHLDVYWTHLNPTMAWHSRPAAFRRRKPDLVGLDAARKWVVLETKGRTDQPKSDVLPKAKQQTRFLRRIGGQYPVLRAGVVAYFDDDDFEAVWEDPEAPEAEVDAEVDTGAFLRAYYEPLANLTAEGITAETTDDLPELRVTYLEEIDVTVGLDNRVIGWLNSGEGQFPQLGGSRTLLPDARFPVVQGEQPVGGYLGSDGVLVSLGPNWSLVMSGDAAGGHSTA